MAIELFHDMKGRYPKGGALAVRELMTNTDENKGFKTLVKVKESQFIDTDGDHVVDAVVDAWGRPLIYTRYVANAPNQQPGTSNGESGVQPINNPKNYDLFSCGPYADRNMQTFSGTAVTINTTSWTQYQSDALTNDGARYNGDQAFVVKGTKRTGEINRYVGNW